MGRNPAALGGVVGEELGAEEDLSILNRRQIDRLDRKGGIGAVEDGFTDNLAVEHPLASLSGKRHGVCDAVVSIGREVAAKEGPLSLITSLQASSLPRSPP